MNTETIVIAMQPDVRASVAMTLQAALSKVSMLTRERKHTGEAARWLTDGETAQLQLSPSEADSLAYVLMTCLHHEDVTMVPIQRTHSAEVANALFDRLGYGHHTNEQGDRVEDVKR